MLFRFIFSLNFIGIPRIGWGRRWRRGGIPDWLFLIKTCRVDIPDRVVSTILKSASIDRPASFGIYGDPSPEPRRVIAGSLITQASFFIPLLSRKSIPLRCRLDVLVHRLVRGTAVRVVLLVGDDLCLVVQLQRRGAEVIFKLKADE